MEEIELMSFKSFLQIIEEHENGTYVCANLDQAFADKLYKWASVNVTNAKLVPPKDYHATIIYSRKGVPGVLNEKYDLPYEARITEWKILGDEAKCLCLALASPDLFKINKYITDIYGATSDYNSYVPHVTVAYDYTGQIPDKLPRLQKLSFDSIKITGLEPNWRPE